MKKVVLTFGAGLLVFMAHAQKGSWYIGGNAGYNVTQQSYNGSKDHRSTTWSFSPEIGTFLNDNFQLGAAVTLAGQKSETFDAYKNVIKSNMTGGSVYARYFFGNGLFRPFVGMNITFLPGSVTHTDSMNNTGKYQTLNYGANINAGFALALSSRVTAVGSFGALGYNKTMIKPEGSGAQQTSESFGFNEAGTLGQRFNVGIYYTFLK